MFRCSDAWTLYVGIDVTPARNALGGVRYYAWTCASLAPRDETAMLYDVIYYDIIIIDFIIVCYSISHHMSFSIIPHK